MEGREAIIARGSTARLRRHDLHTIEQIDVLFEILHMARFVCLQTASKMHLLTPLCSLTTKTETEREGILPSLSFLFLVYYFCNNKSHIYIYINN